jgi:hypothetical protein
MTNLSLYTSLHPVVNVSSQIFLHFNALIYLCQVLRPRGRGYVDGSRGPYCLREGLEAGRAMRDVMNGTEGWVEQAKEHLCTVNEVGFCVRTFQLVFGNNSESIGSYPAEGVHSNFGYFRCYLERSHD